MLTYIENTAYDATVARITGILNTSKRTAQNPFRPVNNDCLQYNLASALWCSRIEGGAILDPLWTEQRRGKSLIVALAAMDVDPATGTYTADQVHWTLWDAGVFPARAREGSVAIAC